MKGKIAAVLVTCMMIIGSLGALASAAVPAPGPRLPAPGAPSAPWTGGAGRGTTPNNDSEPNDDFANATLITGDTTFEGGVGMGDQDYFKVSLSSGATADTLEVQLTLLLGVTVLDILDPNHMLMLRDGTPPQAGDTLKLQFTAFMTGYYYIFLPNRGPCNYSLTTVLGTAPFTSDGDNTPATPTVIPTGFTTYSTVSTLDNHTDISDFYKVHLNYTQYISTDVLKAFLKVPASCTFGIALYASGAYETALAGVLDFPAEAQNGSFTFSPLAGGDYFLRVWGPRGSGQYTLNLSRANGTADQNNDANSATSLELSAPHWYNTTGDVTLGIDQDDYFMIGSVVVGQAFNCTVTSQDYDAGDETPNMRIELLNNTQYVMAPDPTDNLADPVAYSNARADEAGNIYVHLNITEWAGRYDLRIYSNSPPAVAAPIENMSFPENSFNTAIKLNTVFSDPDGDPLTFTYELYGELLNNMNVTIGNDPDRTVNLTPAANWRGSGSMSWTATDPKGEQVTEMVHQIVVTRINHAPEVINDSIPLITLQMNQVDNTKLNMTTIFSEPDEDQGDYITYNVSGNTKITISFPKDPNNLLKHTGEVIIRPDLDWTGVETVSFTATDTGGLVSPAVSVTIEVIEVFVEKVTVATAPRVMMEEDGSNSSLNVLTYFNSTAPGDSFNLIYLAASGTHLIVTLAADGKLTVVPQADWYGMEVLRFRGTCQHGMVANLTITVEVTSVNDLPVPTPVLPAPGVTTQTINETQTARFKVNVSDKETALNQLKIKWTLDGVNVSSLTDYNFTTDYDTVTGQPSRTYLVRLTVNDSLATVSLSWNVTVNNLNRAPRDVRITFPPENQSFVEGTKVHFIGAAVDDDGDTLKYEWYDGTKLLGSGVELNTTKLGAKNHNITLKVSDASSSSTTSIIVKVTPKKSPGFEAAVLMGVVAVAAVLVAATRRRK